MDIASIAGTLMRMGAPVLGGALGGPAGAAVATTVIGALASAFETDPTPEAVGEALERQEAAIVVQRVEKAETTAVIEAVNQYIQDTQDARRQTLQLVESGSSIAWGAPIVSAVVMLTFGAVMVRVTMAGIPAGSEAIYIGLVETLKTLTIAVVSYWVGSSAGSRGKDATIASMSQSAGGQIVDAAAGAVKAVIKGRR